MTNIFPSFPLVSPKTTHAHNKWQCVDDANLFFFHKYCEVECVWLKPGCCHGSFFVSFSQTVKESAAVCGCQEHVIASRSFLRLMTHMRRGLFPVPISSMFKNSLHLSCLECVKETWKRVSSWFPHYKAIFMSFHCLPAGKNQFASNSLLSLQEHQKGVRLGRSAAEAQRSGGSAQL